jgi:tRNA threonylcarbamoyladenosine biosynthesis protein TsaB
VAAEAFDHGDDSSRKCVLVAQDAHMNEVYLATFAADRDGLPRQLTPVRLQVAGPIDGLPDDCMAAGAGWERYPALWQANRERLAGRLDIRYPRASRLIPLATEALRQGEDVDPERLMPAYVREQVATPPAS